MKNDGDLELKEVEESGFLFSARIPNHVGTCVRVIKKEQLKAFSERAKILANTIRSELKSDEDAAFKEFKNK